jgi:hypothetical protein
MPFRLTSRDWQESDRFLAGIMTGVRRDRRGDPIDGVGKFDGVMLGAFRRPRIEGRFTGSEMRAVGRATGARSTATSSSRTRTPTSAAP